MPKLLFSKNVQVQKILETRDIDEAQAMRPLLSYRVAWIHRRFRIKISVETQVMDAWGGGQIIEVGLLATFDQIRTHSIYVWYIYHNLP